MHHKMDEKETKLSLMQAGVQYISDLNYVTSQRLALEIVRFVEFSPLTALKCVVSSLTLIPSVTLNKIFL